MKSTGIVRKIDDLGRIVLPIEMRRVLDIDEGSSLEIYAENDSIVLKKYQPNCIFCGSKDGIELFKGRNICKSCKDELAK